MQQPSKPSVAGAYAGPLREPLRMALTTVVELTADRSWLRLEVAERDLTIATLKLTVSDLRAQLAEANACCAELQALLGRSA